MPDYSKGKIYTIRCRNDDTLIYVGSTTQALCERLAQHKRSCKREKYKDRLLYKTINGDWNIWYIELYESFACENKEQLCKKEGEIIREIGNLNMEISGRTGKEYYKDNKEIILKKAKDYQSNNKEKITVRKKEYRKNNIENIKIKDKEYYDNNRDKILEKIKEKITCECGCNITKTGLNRHLKSQKHIMFQTH